MNNMYIK